MAWFERDGLTLNYLDEGRGAPFVFQHGLGATTAQPFEVMPDDTRNVVLECRAHGRSDVGPHDALSIDTFSNDLEALIDRLELDRPILGGISMGAAVTLRLALRRPDRIGGMVLARPAWLLDPAPPNMAIFRMAAEHMKNGGAGLERFQKSKDLAALAKRSPDNAQSIVGQFDAPDLASRAALLEAIAADGPGVTAADLARLADIPVLVIANGEDEIHPLPMARNLAGLIPGARYLEITAKSVSKPAYLREFREALARFAARIGHVG